MKSMKYLHILFIVEYLFLSIISAFIIFISIMFLKKKAPRLLTVCDFAATDCFIAFGTVSIARFCSYIVSLVLKDWNIEQSHLVAKYFSIVLFSISISVNAFGLFAVITRIGTISNWPCVVKSDGK